MIQSREILYQALLSHRFSVIRLRTTIKLDRGSRLTYFYLNLAFSLVETRTALKLEHRSTLDLSGHAYRLV